MNEFNDKDNEIARGKAEILDDFIRELATIGFNADLAPYSSELLKKIVSLTLRYNKFIIQNLKS